ncbi:hypothetical protein UA08_04914 [Talaromyces atroroseus]|uniref:Thioesterase domain-containing protein n=1 Tax=Talaromyces atroroseus TaxID=1441469 RepID=A0A225AF33_TALAT|nr:hypothetical protein UA08_04914 [Talaromyces atroroseus]OKL59912.1 hypothetical protein UA08_04914 [Talaromyces atroroseus]
MSSVLSHVQNVWQTQRANSPIYALLLANVTIEDASEGTIHARLQVDKSHTNSKGGLHGALTACIVDWVAGSLLAMGRHTRGAAEGEILEISGRSLKMGGTLAFLSVEISKMKDGKSVVVATGLHTKYVRQNST